MVDIHTHVRWGLDDGAATLEFAAVVRNHDGHSGSNALGSILFRLRIVADKARHGFDSVREGDIEERRKSFRGAHSNSAASRAAGQ